MRATEAASPNYPGAPIRYLHTREIDSFYHSTRSISGGSAGKTKVRVTRDQSSNNSTIKSSVMKSRIADMNVYSPKRGFDFRISVSVEEPGKVLYSTLACDAHVLMFCCPLQFLYQLRNLLMNDGKIECHTSIRHSR